MKSLGITKAIGLALGAAALVLTSQSVDAAAIRANAGTTFVNAFGPGGITHTVDGVADVSLVGNCRVHFDIVGQPPPSPDQPILLSGILTMTAASGDTLRATVEGAVAFGNAGFGNFYYTVTFTGGTGPFADARGQAKIQGVAVATSPEGDKGTATWRLKGQVLGVNHGGE